MSADAAALTSALERAGIPVAVESAGSLAVLRPVEGHSIDWPAARSTAVRIAAEHGFSHIALELPGDRPLAAPDGATE